MAANKSKKSLNKKIVLICKTCNKTFPEVSKLQEHKRIHEELATLTVPVHDLFERPYACEECGKTFSGRRTLLKHMRLHSGVLPFSCGVCNKTFYQISKWIDHSRVHTDGNKFPCSFCSEMFSRKKKFVTHLKTHEINPFQHKVKSEGRGFALSGDILTVGQESSGRGKSIHTIERQVSSGSNQTNVITHYSLFTYGMGYNPFSCSKEQLSNLAQDKRFFPKDPFLCNFCRATFTRKESLKKHLGRVHAAKTGTRNTFCELCFKFFPKKDIMAMVDLGKSTYSVPYSAYGSRVRDGNSSVLLVLSCSSCMFICDKFCTLCGKTVRLCDLRTHLKLHTGELIPCTKCGLLFSDDNALSRHRESCMANCPVCDLPCVDEIALKEHKEEFHDKDDDLFQIPTSQQF